MSEWIIDQPKAQPPMSRWVATAITYLLWAILVISFVPSSWRMALAFFQWLTQWQWQDFLTFIAICGLLVRSARRSGLRERWREQSIVKTYTGITISEQDLHVLRRAKRLVPNYNASGQLIGFSALNEPSIVPFAPPPKVLYVPHGNTLVSFNWLVAIMLRRLVGIRYAIAYYLYRIRGAIEQEAYQTIVLHAYWQPKTRNFFCRWLCRDRQGQDHFLTWLALVRRRLR